MKAGDRVEINCAGHWCHGAKVTVTNVYDEDHHLLGVPTFAFDYTFKDGTTEGFIYGQHHARIIKEQADAADPLLC